MKNKLGATNKFKPSFLSASESSLGGSNKPQAQQPAQQQTGSPPLINELSSNLNSKSPQTVTSQQQQIPNILTTALNRAAEKKLAALSRQQQHHHHHQQVINVPQFYFPHGRHDDRQFRSIDDVECMKQLSVEFKTKKEGKMFKEDFADVLKLLGLPSYWKILVFRACTAVNKLTYVTYSVFEQVWSK